MRYERTEYAVLGISKALCNPFDYNLVMLLILAVENESQKRHFVLSWQRAETAEAIAARQWREAGAEPDHELTNAKGIAFLRSLDHQNTILLSNFFSFYPTIIVYFNFFERFYRLNSQVIPSHQNHTTSNSNLNGRKRTLREAFQDSRSIHILLPAPNSGRK